jgi:hypothetical protein
MFVLLEACVAPTLASTYGLAQEAQSSIGVSWAEISMKLIKNHTLPRKLGRDVLRVNVRVLPCPAHFDQITFICDPHTKRSSIARAGIEYDARVRPSDMGLNGKAYAGSITDEWSEIKMQWLWFRLLLRAENGGERDQQHRDENKHVNCFLSQFSASPISI